MTMEDQDDASQQSPQQRAFPPHRRVISSRACDRCRRRKARCDAANPGLQCSLCREAGEECTFDVPLSRRGPKTRKKATTALVARGSASLPPPPLPTPILPNDAAAQHGRPMRFHQQHHGGPPGPSALSFSGAATGGGGGGSQQQQTGSGHAVEQQQPPTWNTSSSSGGGGRHGLSPQTVRSSVSDMSGTVSGTVSGTRPAMSALQRWHSLSRTLALVHFDIEGIVNRCLNLFFEYLYPLTPLVHEPSLREGLAFFLQNSLSSSEPIVGPVPNDDAWLRGSSVVGYPPRSEPAAAPAGPGSSVLGGRGAAGMEPWPDSTFTLITAVCAEAAFLLPKDIFVEGESVADMFLQASRACLHDYLEADLDSPNANSVTIRYFHSNCLHAAGKPKYSWHIFGEATRLAQVMQLHEESSLEGLLPVEAELRRRAFWIVYMGDKSAAILNHRPITIHKFSFESGITTCYPTGIEDESSIGPSPTSLGGGPPSDAGGSRRSFIEGFNANLRLWQTASDLLLEIRLLHDSKNTAAAVAAAAAAAGISANESSSSQQGVGVPPPTSASASIQRMNGEDRQKLDDLYVRFITCLDELPPYLQSYTFAAIASGGKETTQSNQFIIQCANLQVSLHCLRMVITQKFEDLCYFGSSMEQADLRRTEIARDMLRVIHEAPFWSLQVNGEPYVEKIRLIGASLMAIIHRNQDSPLATRARADFSVLLDILTRLDSKASDALKSHPTWDVYTAKG